MSGIRYREMKLDNLFELNRGTVISKKYINSNPGDIPVYSSAIENDGVIGYISDYKYDGEYITWATDNVFKPKYRNGKFNCTNVCGIMTLKKEYRDISLKYIAKYLENSGTDFSWQNKASISNISGIIVKIPINNDNTFDIVKQNEIVNKYKVIDQRKHEIREKLIYFNEVKVDLLSKELGKFKTKFVKELFDLSINTNGSKFTKTFINDNPGTIPVYGASNNDTIPSYGYVKENAVIRDRKGNESKVKYFRDCLTYNIDGLAGYVFYRKGLFSLSEKVRPLIIQDDYINQLNPEYLKYIMEPIFRRNVKGRKGQDGKNEYTKLNIKMIENIKISIPIKNDGSFDLEKQNEIVNKYKTIDRIKKEITAITTNLITTEIDFSN